MYSDVRDILMHRKQVSYDDFVKAGSLAAAREKGLVSLTNSNSKWLILFVSRSVTKSKFDLLWIFSVSTSCDEDHKKIEPFFGF